MTSTVKKGINILQLEKGLTYFLEGLRDISPNGKLAVCKNRMVEIYQMGRILKKKKRFFQSFDFFDRISSIVFSGDSKFLILLSFQPSEVHVSLPFQYFVTIYSIESQCFIVRFPYRNPRYSKVNPSLLKIQNIGKYLFIQSQEIGVDVMEIQFVKNIPREYFLEHMHDLHFKFK
jgi:hypothetical protein